MQSNAPYQGLVVKEQGCALILAQLDRRHPKVDSDDAANLAQRDGRRKSWKRPTNFHGLSGAARGWSHLSVCFGTWHTEACSIISRE